MKILTRDIYRGEWKKKEDLLGSEDDDDYNYIRIDGLTKEQLDKMNIIYATYETGSYEGESFILWEQDGKLYEHNCHHCSCYGLTWDDNLEETTLESILRRNTGWIDDFKKSVKWTE